MAEIHINNIKQIIDKENAISTDKKSFNAAIQIVRFYIDNFEFALDIMDVKEIKEMDKIRNLPNSLPFVKGLLNLRGDIIPVLDLKKKLELENLSLKDLANLGKKHKENNEITNNDKEINDINEKTNIKTIQNEDQFQNENASIIICKTSSDIFGIIVDKIYRVQYLTDEEYEPTPILFENIGKSFIKGFAKIDKKIIVILSLDNLFFN